MKETFSFFGILILVVCIGLGGLFLARFTMPFQEETRRLTYEESATAVTACKSEVLRLYREWHKAGSAHKRAIELTARDEADRERCRNLDPHIKHWLENIE